MRIKSIDCGIEIKANFPLNIVNDFARRYIPELDFGGGKDAEIVWEKGKNEVEAKSIELGKIDKFVISSAPPKPYENEHPFFFLLHVFSRLYEKKGYILFTDSAVFAKGKEGILLLGPPHSGKSTIMILAVADGFTPLANENSVFEVKNGKLLFKGGATNLTFSPRLNGLIKEDGKTRSGYGMLDLRKFKRKKAEIKKIFYLHSSFCSTGFDIEKIKGRKIRSLLWEHASQIISGGIFYKKAPLNLNTMELNKRRAEKIGEIGNAYLNEFFEVFGSHKEIFEKIKEMI